MPKLREPGEVPYPPLLAAYDPREWECLSDWKSARAQWAKEHGYPHKKLPLIQAMTRGVWIAQYREDGLTNSQWDGVQRLAGCE
jgi:hypothetical protein